MKTLKIKYLMTVILLVAGSVSFCQNDSNRIFYTNDISINYITGPEVHVNKKTGDSVIVTEYRTIDNIKKLSILNDSTISVSGENISKALLNIEKINSVSVESGSYTLLGIGAGTLAGIGVGALIISSTKVEETNPFGTIVVATGNTLLGGLSVIAGAVVGGIIGGNITSHNDYDLRDYKFQKKEELQRILINERK